MMRKLPAGRRGVLTVAMGAAVVVTASTGVALASPSGPVTVSATAHAATPQNVDFRGVWASSSGGWQVLTENLVTGDCTGTTDFVGYTFTGCKVTGNSYVFVINLGATYHSYDSGTISGNLAQGQFNDTNGRAAIISATRTQSASTTKITAKPTKAKKGKAVTYSVHVSSFFGPPRGKVQVKAGKKLLCTITVSSTGAGSCKTTKTPLGTRQAVTASYAGSAVPLFTGSKGTVRITITK
jgi:hypothetical protein